MAKNKTILTKPKIDLLLPAAIVYQLKKKALFIVNPISGGKKKDGVPRLIQKYLDTAIYEYLIVFTDGAEHAREMAKEAVVDKYDLVVAVGGDGTINEVASSLVNTDIPLGIIPCGSGNGLSRFLSIPMDMEKAVKNLNTGQLITIDSGIANGQAFFNMAGMGFDAHISEVFAHEKRRGFITYIKSTFQEIASYKTETYQIDIDGKSYKRDAFMLSFANSSQYGNNAHVSPNASVQDALLDVCIIKKFPLWRLIELGIRSLNKTAGKTGYIEIIRGKHIKVTRGKPGPIHLDGEPQLAGETIEINVVPHSLKIIAGDNFKGN